MNKYENISISTALNEALNEACELKEANVDLANRFFNLIQGWDKDEVIQDLIEFIPDKVLQDYVNWLEETSLDESYNLKKSKD